MDYFDFGFVFELTNDKTFNWSYVSITDQFQLNWINSVVFFSFNLIKWIFRRLFRIALFSSVNPPIKKRDREINDNKYTRRMRSKITNNRFIDVVNFDHIVITIAKQPKKSRRMKREKKLWKIQTYRKKGETTKQTN